LKLVNKMLLCRMCVRRRQHMRVQRPLNTFMKEILYQILQLVVQLNNQLLLH